MAISSAGWLILIRVRFSMLVHRSRTMQGLNLKKKLKKVSKFLVKFENDVNCAGLAEAVSGSGKVQEYALFDHRNRYRRLLKSLTARFSMDLVILPVKLVICTCRMEPSRI